VKKISVLVPDGIGVRNYLYSDVLKGIEKDCVIIHNFNSDAIELIKKESGIIWDEKIPNYKEGFLEKFYREVIHKTRLHWNSKLVNNPTILANYKPSKRNIQNKIFYAFVNLFSRIIIDYKHITYLELRYERALKRNKYFNIYRDLIQKLDIDVVLCTHQRALVAPILFRVAKDLGVKTIAVIYSWDNLPKARLALRADEYLVWSDYMKGELRQFYPEISQDKIYVTGSPQFEFSLDEGNIIDKDTFFKSYKLNPNKKNICFSANDLTSPNEVLYLQDLITDLHKHNAFEEYQLLFRQNPADLSGRFNKLLEQNKDFVSNISPIWKTTSKEDWASNIPTKDDIKLLTSTCFYSDVVINLGSTMIFDFSVFSKPCIYIKYNKENLAFDVDEVYQFQHFRSMPDEDSVGWVHSKDDFYMKIKDVLDRNRVDGRNWFNTVINHYDSSSMKIQERLIG
jgi:hypothetical protein